MERVDRADGETRRKRMADLIEQRRYSAALDEAAAQLAALGLADLRPGAVTAEAVQAAYDSARRQNGFPQTWHRAWGARLHDEVLATSAQLADALQGERGVLVWKTDATSANTRVSTSVGFVVSVAMAIRRLSGQVGPAEYSVGHPDTGTDLLIVSEDGASGLRLEYNHYPRMDEYALSPWGRYARVLL